MIVVQNGKSSTVNSIPTFKIVNSDSFKHRIARNQCKVFHIFLCNENNRIENFICTLFEKVHPKKIDVFFSASKSLFV